MDISVITFTLGGRSRYLQACIDSVYIDSRQENFSVEHHLVLQGYSKEQLEEDLCGTWENSDNYKFIIHEWPENIGIGAGLNKIIPQCTAPLIMKMDDDCEIISKEFFGRALELHKKFPNDVFSPYPVGLINNPGGPRGFKHTVWKSEETGAIYTRRHVTHVGGFARFTPKSMFDNFKFSSDLIAGISGNEDGQLSQYCGAAGTTMFYLENAMIVEHNESTLGQVVRYPEYFKNRSNESNMKIEVIE